VDGAYGLYTNLDVRSSIVHGIRGITLIDMCGIGRLDLLISCTRAAVLGTVQLRAVTTHVSY